MTSRVALRDPPPASAGPWLSATAALVALWLWILILYRDSGSAMVLIWSRSQTFTHGFLVLPIVLWLVWRKRAEITAQQPQAAPVMLLLAGAVAFAWLLGALAGVNALTQLSFVALLVLTVPVMLGWGVAGVIFFPLAFSFFAVPLGEFLLPPLMEWTANVTVLAVRLSGIPVYREGNDFVIPTGAWSVVEACSGVRYLIASVTVGTLFAYLNFRSAGRRWMFVGVALVVPVVANWMRAYMIVMLGHLSGNTLAVGVDHLLYGWVFFGVVIALMFMVGTRWSDVGPIKNPALEGEDRPTRILAPLSDSPWPTAACLAALVALPHAALWAMHPAQGPTSVDLRAPTALADGWQTDSATPPELQPAFQNTSAELNHTYQHDDQRVGLYVGYYRRPGEGRELVSSSNSLLAKDDRSRAWVGSVSRDVQAGPTWVRVRAGTVRHASLISTDSGHSLLVWQFYWINGRTTSSDYLAKAYLALDRLWGRGDDSAVVLVYGVQSPEGEAILASFMKTNYDQILSLLQRAHSAGP